MKLKLKSLSAAAVILALAAVSCSEKQDFITRDGARFIRGGQPYYFVGANYWAGPLLASPGQSGDRERLSHDLDVLQAAGVDNLRVLVGADEGGVNNKSIIPFLQSLSGELDEDLLVGLDYFMAELGRRGMTAVLYMNNDCAWSGGYSHYVKRVIGGECPSFWSDKDYRPYAGKFIELPECQELYYDFVRAIVGRVNSVTGVAYKDDPAIFSWQIGNEPRALLDELNPQFRAWLHKSAELIRSLDPNHMISTGIEGMQGCGNEPEQYETIHADPLIDYLTFHVWPNNHHYSDVYAVSDSVIQAHLDVAEKLGKPLVIEEFGLVRDGWSLDPSAPASERNEFYGWLFEKVKRSAADGGNLAGANFWAFAGAGRARDAVWELGDDFLGDPPFEPQGKFSVFDSDSTTLAIVADINGKL